MTAHVHNLGPREWGSIIVDDDPQPPLAPWQRDMILRLLLPTNVRAAIGLFVFLRELLAEARP